MESIPYDKRSGKIWFNGALINWSEVKIHVLSHGLHYASCVFEGERVYDGKIFKFEEHTDRLFYSASRMGFKIPFTQESLNKSCKEIVEVQKVKNGYGNSHLPLISKTLDALRYNKKRSPISISHAISSTELIHALYSSEENRKWELKKWQEVVNYFKNEIIPVEVQLKKKTLLIDTDEEPLRFNEEKIKALRPAFDKNGNLNNSKELLINKIKFYLNNKNINIEWNGDNQIQTVRTIRYIQDGIKVAQ